MTANLDPYSSLYVCTVFCVDVSVHLSVMFITLCCTGGTKIRLIPSLYIIVYLYRCMCTFIHNMYYIIIYICYIIWHTCEHTCVCIYITYNILSPSEINQDSVDISPALQVGNLATRLAHVGAAKNAYLAVGYLLGPKKMLWLPGNLRGNHWGSPSTLWRGSGPEWSSKNAIQVMLNTSKNIFTMRNTKLVMVN